jgi:ADP-ribosylglycohydrolase
MEHVMRMPGGGYFSGIKPGQVTDDSELAISLADGLIE